MSQVLSPFVVSMRLFVTRAAQHQHVLHAPRAASVSACDVMYFTTSTTTFLADAIVAVNNRLPYLALHVCHQVFQLTVLS
jgi:hypothetical protein